MQWEDNANTTNIDAGVAWHTIYQQRYDYSSLLATGHRPLLRGIFATARAGTPTSQGAWHNQECARDQPDKPQTQYVSLSSLRKLHTSRQNGLPLTTFNCQPVTFSDTSESDTSSSDDTEPRRDSQWKSPPAQTPKAVNDKTPTTSCFGHFDRLDIEYTPKLTTKARVVVYHDGPNDAWSWSNTAVLKDAGIASQDFAARCGIDGMEGVVEEGEAEAISQGRAQPAASSTHDADEEELSTEQQIELIKQALNGKLKEEEYAAMDNEASEEVELSEPLKMLTSLQVSDDAERVLQAEDLYFAGRLAATCMILQLDGMDRAAEVLGQWSVDLVGKRYWDEMVVSYGTAPRHENETGDWIAYLLGEVDINLQKFDEGKAKELRDFVGELQEFGIIPARETQAEATGGQ